MGQISPTEVTTKFAATVDDLTDAWEFVMKHLESVGSAPEIHITPFWSSDDDFEKVYFEVWVSGMEKKN